MTNTEQLYAVVYHHQYSPQGYRMYQLDSPYLKDYPSMYTMIEDNLTQEAAKNLMEESNRLEWQHEVGLMGY